MAEEDEDLFEEEESLSRPELRAELRKCTTPIPKTGGKKFFPPERVKLEKEIFTRKYGGEISKDDWRKALREVKNIRNKTKDRAERAELNKRFLFLKKIGPK